MVPKKHVFPLPNPRNLLPNSHCGSQLISRRTHSQSELCRNYGTVGFYLRDVLQRLRFDLREISSSLYSVL